MTGTENRVYYVLIRADPAKKDKVRYSSLKERFETYRFYSIVSALIFHGAKRMEAEETARWICRKAKPGDRKVIDPGIVIEVAEDEDRDV